MLLVNSYPTHSFVQILFKRKISSSKQPVWGVQNISKRTAFSFAVSPGIGAMFTTSHGRERGDERSSSRIFVHRDGVQLFFAAKRGKAKKLQTHKRVFGRIRSRFPADSKFLGSQHAACSKSSFRCKSLIEKRFDLILWSWNIMIPSLVSQPLWLVSFPKHSRPSMYPFYGATSSAFTWIKTTFPGVLGVFEWSKAKARLDGQRCSCTWVMSLICQSNGDLQ